MEMMLEVVCFWSMLIPHLVEFLPQVRVCSPLSMYILSSDDSILDLYLAPQQMRRLNSRVSAQLNDATWAIVELRKEAWPVER